MWQSVLRWSEKVWHVADMAANEKKYLLSEQLSRNAIFWCWSSSQGTSRMIKITLVIFYCLLFKFDFSFLFCKLYLFLLTTSQQLQAYLELCAKQIINDKCASVDKHMPIPDAESILQNIQRFETFTFAGAGSDNLFYNCRASAHIFLITFWRDQRREWDDSPDNIIRNTFSSRWMSTHERKRLVKRMWVYPLTWLTYRYLSNSH